MEFLEVTFNRHGTCKLLCDTSLTLARSSPTRRYTGKIGLALVCTLATAVGCTTPSDEDEEGRGDDGITNEILRHLGPKTKKELLRICTHPGGRKKSPRMAHSDGDPYPEGGKDKKLLGNYMPITLISNVSKLLEVEVGEDVDDVVGRRPPATAPPGGVLSSVLRIPTLATPGQEGAMVCPTVPTSGRRNSPVTRSSRSTEAYRDRSVAIAARPRLTHTSYGLATGASRPVPSPHRNHQPMPPNHHLSAAPTSGAQQSDAWRATRRRTPRGTSRCGAHVSASSPPRAGLHIRSAIRPTTDDVVGGLASARTRAARLRPGVSRSRGRTTTTTAAGAHDPGRNDTLLAESRATPPPLP